MSTFQVLVLAALQGLTEFLPVSSSGHLVLVPYFMRWPEPGLEFTVAVHLGTLLAVVAFFRREIGAVFSKAARKRQEKGTCTDKGDVAGIGPHTIGMILLGTLPAGVIGLTLHAEFEKLFAMPVRVGGFLLITAALLFLSERLAASKRSTADMRWWQALLIGFAQGCAIAPGISRSGTTIAAGLFLGFERTQATKFAFLLSIPAILGAGALELPRAHEFSPVWLLGVAVSALSGYVAIKWVLSAVQGSKLRYFALYCLLMAGATFLYRLVT